MASDQALRTKLKALVEEWAGACAFLGFSDEEAAAFRECSHRLAALLAESEAEPHWLIWSNYHRAYWGPGGQGYADIAGAGRYTLSEALSWAGRRSVDPSDPRSNPPELVVPAPELIAILRPDCEAKAKLPLGHEFVDRKQVGCDCFPSLDTCNSNGSLGCHYLPQGVRASAYGPSRCGRLRDEH